MLVNAQTKTITGKVTDTTGVPISGASVVVKGGRKGVSTAVDGAFTMKVPASATTIVISYVGFLEQEVLIASLPASPVILKPKGIGLNEVVVVAYGTQKKTALTSAISTVSGKELSKAPVADVSNAIGGRVPGVIFKETSGEPGYSTANIQIRGGRYDR
jgi:hypothetical protein